MAQKQNRILSHEEGFTTGAPNRAHHIRRDDDMVKSVKVSLYDIDYAIMYHMSDNLKLQVVENEVVVPVPVIYADGEKWMQARSRGYLRDDKKRVMAPIVAVRRLSYTADERLPIVDLNNYVPRRTFFPFKSNHNKYDTFGSQIARKPSYEYYLIDLPNYIRVSYEVIVWTHLIEQLNDICQAMTAVSNHLWGDFHVFRTVVDNVNMNVNNAVGEDRVVSTNISLTVDGYLREEFEYHEPTINKAYTVKKVNVANEREEPDLYTEMPYLVGPTQHISQEPYTAQRINKRRNLRHR